MSTLPPHPRPTPRVRTLLLIAAACATLWPGAGAAASVSGHDRVAAGEHKCACKTCRGATVCCCASGREDKDASTPKPGHDVAHSAAAPAPGPCVGEAPCGGGGLPAPTPGGPVVESAVLASALAVRPDGGRRVLAPDADTLYPSPLDDRLVDPPERASAL